jgi:hypothetical protein
MSLHVLGHLLELPRLASADWRGSGAQVPGVGLRAATLVAALLAGIALAVLTLPLGSDWLSG